jgi:dihydrofolate reductase
MINIIAALARNGAIGYENNLIYRLPDDLKRFKALTTGHSIIMGRHTFESFPKGALPNRRNIVLSRNGGLTLPGAEVFATWEDALEACREEDEVFIIGGGSIYSQALPYADRLLLTLVDDTPEKADTFFPPLCTSEWEITSIEHHGIDDKHPFHFSYIDCKRVKR